MKNDKKATFPFELINRIFQHALRERDYIVLSQNVNQMHLIIFKKRM